MAAATLMWEGARDSAVTTWTDWLAPLGLLLQLSNFVFTQISNLLVASKTISDLQHNVRRPASGQEEAGGEHQATAEEAGDRPVRGEDPPALRWRPDADPEEPDHPGAHHPRRHLPQIKVTVSGNKILVDESGLFWSSNGAEENEAMSQQRMSQCSSWKN